MKNQFGNGAPGPLARKFHRENLRTLITTGLQPGVGWGGHEPAVSTAFREGPQTVETVHEGKRRRPAGLKPGTRKSLLARRELSGRTLINPGRPPGPWSALRKTLPTLVACLVALVFAPGCASTKVTDQQTYVTGKIPRPNNIIVYNFAASPADIPPDSTFAGEFSGPTDGQSAKDLEDGRALGAAMAEELVAEIRDLGMIAQVATPGIKPAINDIVIRGYLLSVDEGSATKRVAIGFGSGSSKLTAAVESFQMTAQGLRKLGSGKADAGGSKTPGAALGVVAFAATANPVGLIVSGATKVYGEASGSSKIEGRGKAIVKEIMDHIKIRFKEQGWI